MSILKTVENKPPFFGGYRKWGNMKKFFFILFAVVGVSMSLCAAQMCVRRISSKDWECLAGGRGIGDVEWTLNCFNYSEDYMKLDLYGVSSCSVMVGRANMIVESQLFSTRNMKSPVGSEKHCWCKMVYPAKSAWVFSGKSFSSVSECLEDCGRACAETKDEFSAADAFIEALFSSLEKY